MTDINGCRSCGENTNALQRHLRTFTGIFTGKIPLAHMCFVSLNGDNRFISCVFKPTPEGTQLGLFFLTDINAACSLKGQLLVLCKTWAVANVGHYLNVSEHTKNGTFCWSGKRRGEGSLK